MQYCDLLHEWAWYFHELKASENVAHECNNRDMHTYECNEVFILHYHNRVVSLSHSVPSNSQFEHTSSNSSTL